MWEPKVLRSGAGSHFHVPIINNLSWEAIDNYLPSECKVYVADCRRPTEKRVQQWTECKDLETLMDWSVEDAAFKPPLYSGSTDNTTMETLDSDKRLTHTGKMKLFSKAPLEVIEYDRISYTDKHIVLVIGGETTGVSAEARKLAFDHYGQCVFIPMGDGVDSLNSAVSGSILMYEVWRQIQSCKM